MRMLMLSGVLAVALSSFGCAETVTDHAPTLTSATPESWDGVYSANWTGAPVIPGDTPLAVHYVVRVSTLPTGSVAVDITADGLHIGTRMKGEGRAEGLTLGVHFTGCNPDDMSKCDGYYKGDRLVSLRRVNHLVTMEFAKMGAPDLKTRDLAMHTDEAPTSAPAALALRAPAR